MVGSECGREESLLSARSLSGYWVLSILIAFALLALALVLVSGPTVAGANEHDDPIDLGFPLNLAQQTYLGPALYAEGAEKYPTDGDGYAFEYDINGVPTTGQDPANANLVGRGPHGGYDTATFKCQTCHSPHAAEVPTPGAVAGSVGGSKLLRAGASGCEYCHVGAAIASGKSVYQGHDDLYNFDDGDSGHQLGVKNSVPNSTLTSEPGSTFTLTCGSCHSVHGATEDLWKPTDFFTNPNGGAAASATSEVGYKLLKSDPSGLGIKAPEFREIESAPTTDPATVNQFAFSWWCTNCHNDANNDGTARPYDANEPAATADIRLGTLLWGESVETTTFTTSDDSHPHSDELADGYVGVRPDPVEGIYAGPGQCYTCHRGGLGSYDPSVEATAPFTPIPKGLDPNVPAEATLLARIEAALADYTAPDGGEYRYVQNALPNLSGGDADEISCSRCHYGTAAFAADTARLYGKADWPHSSGDDYKMLGNWSLNPDEFHAGDVQLVEIPDGGMSATTWQTALCGRCHILIDPAPGQAEGTHLWGRARYPEMHVDMTTFTNLTSGTSGLLGTFFSPGVVGVNP